MKSCCLKGRKDTENINSRVSKTSNSRTMALSQSVQNVEVKNQYLLKIKKQKEY